MRFLQQLTAGLGLMLALMSVQAAPVNPVEGKDYRVLDKVQTTTPGKAVEVTEFFWYGCPHCNSLEPTLAGWVKKQGDAISFKRVPVAFRDFFVPQQKMYYALEAMGQLETLHPKILYAIHAKRQSLDTEADIVKFLEKQGVDKKKFLSLYNSFGVQTKVRRATQLQEDYRIDSVPMLAIDGRYVTSPAMVGNNLNKPTEDAMQQATLRVLDHLVAQGQQQKAAASAAKPALAPAAKK